MGWFDDQIKTRIRLDEDVLDETFQEIAGSVTGKESSAGFDKTDPVSDDDIGEILRYLGIKETEVPAGITDINERLDHALRPAGAMRRNVTLDKGWHLRACGAMLGSLCGSGTVIALLPSRLGGYYYRDRATGRKIRINRFNESRISAEAVAFYKPFPRKELGIPDLIRFIAGTLSFNDVAMTLIVTGIATLIGMLVPVLNKLLIGDVLSSGQPDVLFALTVFLICTAVSKTLFTVVGNLVNQRIQSRMDAAVEAAAMMRVLDLPTDFFRGCSAGELSRNLAYVNRACEILVSVVFQTGFTAVFSLVYVLQMLSYAPALVGPAFCIILVSVIFAAVSALVNMQVSRNIMKGASKESGVSFAVISGIQKIKLAGAETRAFARWGREYAKNVKYNYNPPILVKANGAVSLAISLGGTMWMYFAAIKSGVSAADYYAFNSLYAMVSAAFMQVASIGLSFAGLRPVLEIIEPILKSVPEVNENRQPVTSLSGSIELDNVTFRYSENMPNVLEKLSLRIEPGQYVAIAGRTGCGKSTLLRLLLGFETPQSGAVYYDGKNINTLELHSLRRSIGTVIQNGRLFNEDIYSNIAISAPGLTMDGAWKAAELAGLADDIRMMPMGMYTMLSEDGGGISGGQKQRLMIARAVASRPGILMLDEATSALDNITQKKVIESLDGLDCTRIVIAHRLSTIKNCDRILVLDNGRIAEDGTYEELIAANGLFADLISRQNESVTETVI